MKRQPPENHYRECRFLSREEERELAVLAQQGDAAARETLVRSLMPYVVKLARQASRRCDVPLDDLVAGGNLGLVRALNGFDPQSGKRLITYAHSFIVGHIQREIKPKPPGDEMGTFDETLDDYPTPDGPPYRRAEIAELQECIGRLTPPRQRVIRGRLAGKTFDEIAAECGQTKWNQCLHYQGALKSLRTMLVREAA